MSLTIEVCRSVEAFRALRESWSSLDLASERRSPFLSWGWLWLWWETCRPEAELRIVCAYDRGTLRGLAPLMQRRSRYYRMPIAELAFLGDGTSDRQFFLDSTDDGSATAAIWAFLRQNPFRAGLIRLEQLPSDSPTLTMARSSRSVSAEVSSHLPFITINEDWFQYEKRLSRKFRSEMRTRQKVFAAIGPWEIRHVRGAASSEWVTRMAEIENASRKLATGRAFLAEPQHRLLLQGFAQPAPADGHECVASLLIVNAVVVAYLFGIVFDGKYHAYNMAFLPELAKGSPGKYLMHETIRFAFENRWSEFDFLRGESYVKEKWEPQIRSNWRLVHFYGGLTPRLMRWVVFTLRPAIKTWRYRRSSPVKAPIDSPVEESVGAGEERQ